MTTKFIAPFPFVEIIWDDAVSNSETWVAIADLAAPERVITRGFLVKEADDHVTVASSVYHDDSTKSNTVGNVTTIPKGMIRSRRELGITTKKQKKPK